MNEWSLIDKGQSSLSIDCIKICPLNPQIVGYAFYQQLPSFTGGIAVRKINASSNVQIQQILKIGPVLHICWVPKIHLQNYMLVGAYRSDGIFIGSCSLDGTNLKILKNITLSKNMFCLYIDCQFSSSTNLEIVVSSNQSTVHSLCLDFPSLDVLSQKQLNKHQYAVWTCRLNKQGDKMICGDQVNNLYLYDNKTKQLITKNNSSHSQGICDIVFKDQYLLYTGGFDGKINLIDIRKFQKHVNQHQIQGATIWRIILNNNAQNLLICNSSQNQFIILNQHYQNKWNSQKQHKSLAYSADWTNSTLITNSFYDKIVCIWQKK